jgi:cyclopropane fatty-acyl-phospholipid synthase-like methyltransferase
MRQAWDERARENVRCYIASDDWETEEEFDRSGEESVELMLWDIGQFLSPGAAVLDIGCGIGRMLKPLAQRFRKVHGVDISPEMIRRAKERMKGLKNVEVWANNGRDLRPLQAEQIDLALSLIVFQHIPDPEIIRGYIHDTYRVLKPGGLFKFQVWGRDDTAEAAKTEEESERDTWFGTRFTEREMRQTTAEAGFLVLSMYTWHQPELDYLFVVAQKPSP